MAKYIEVDKDNIVRLYKKFGTVNRVILSSGCSAIKVKKILAEKGIEIKPHIPERLHIGALRSW